jgi:hypothetical protein
MLGDLPVVHPHGVHSFEVDLPAGRRYAQERSLVRPMIGLEGRHDLAIGGLPMDDGVEVGEGLPKGLVEAARAGLVRRHVGLGRIVDEVVGEQLLEYVEIALALHFFGIPADAALAASLGVLVPITSLQGRGGLISCISPSRRGWVRGQNPKPRIIKPPSTTSM